MTRRISWFLTTQPTSPPDLISTLLTFLTTAIIFQDQARKAVVSTSVKVSATTSIAHPLASTMNLRGILREVPILVAKPTILVWHPLTQTTLQTEEIFEVTNLCQYFL
jgi:hypothetical protein